MPACLDHRPPAAVLAERAWLGTRAAHEARVDGWTAGHLDRARRGEAHPVEDFLFTYYSFRPAQLRRWHPGPGVVLAGEAARGHLRWDGYLQTEAGVMLDVAAVVARRTAVLRQVHDLMLRTASRPAQFACFGLHEWAMVYQQAPQQVRHGAWPLRLGASGVAEVVEAHTLRCTHFDAFRFFTPPARGRNTCAPTRESARELEQGGCLHATMDLYKWSYKLAPLTPSALVADAFCLARQVRELDMRASPYDLSMLGYSPVRIEESGGRAEYAAQQREFAARGADIRARLLALTASTLEGWGHGVPCSPSR
jgi:hypothetical protein